MGNHGAKKQWSWAPSSRPNPKTDWGARSSRAIKKFFNKDVMEEADESGMDEFSTFGDEDVTDEAVGGIISAGRKFLPHSTPVENGAKIFMQGRSGSELNKAVNHGAKKQWSWAPSSRPNPKTDWGARSSRAIKKWWKNQRPAINQHMNKYNRIRYRL